MRWEINPRCFQLSGFMGGGAIHEVGFGQEFPDMCRAQSKYPPAFHVSLQL